MTAELAFEGLSIAYDERVLEPRPWTAAQSRWASDLLPGLLAGPVLELCSGAGHIGLAAVADHDRLLIQVDIDPVACEFAAANAARAGRADRVEIRCGAMDAVLDPEERFPLILADPPYLRSDATGQYPADPVGAIDGGADGFDLIDRCLGVMAAHLTRHGVGILQVVDVDQADEVRSRLQAIPAAGLAVSEVRDCGRGALVAVARG